MRAALFCPGRGSYTERTMGLLDPDEPWVLRAEELRREYERTPLLELDGGSFSPEVHLAPAEVSPLIYLHSMLDAREAQRVYEVVCVGGNSLGWYTALAVAGVLSFEDGFRLVQEMSILQEELAAPVDPGARGGGGQLIFPVVDEEWRPEAGLALQVERALATLEGEAFPSIELGGYRVLAGTEAGLASLQRALPRLKRGSTPYPLRLMRHGPYHTPLVAAVAARARETLGRLSFRAPRTTLIDGRGVRFTRWSGDPAQLAEYTLGAQIIEPFDFSASVRVALREYAPDRLVLPGPGNTLGGVCGQVLVAEGWRGIHSRSDFEAVQESDQPTVVSMQR